MKHCRLCGEDKPLDDFYANPNGSQGRMPYCKKCDNARPRKTSAGKVNRTRARHRAVADLISFHEEEFETLLAIRLAEAKEEAEQLAETPAAAEHYKSEPVRLKPGKRMAGEKAGDRIDVARCPHCVKHHDRGHVCSVCGAAPGNAPSNERSRPSNERSDGARSTNQNLVTRYVSGPRVSNGIDPAALEAFNAGTQRAREARR